MKKLLFIALIIMLSLSLFACGGGNTPCDECVDEDGDGICDECGEAVEVTQADLPLFVDGEPTFKVVMADDASPDLKTAVRSLQNNLSRNYGIQIEVALESKSTESEIEILVGNIKSRGEKYSCEYHTLGSKGYIIKLLDTKIIINGGSAEAQLLAFEKFTDDILCLKRGEDILDVTMTAEKSVDAIQRDFNITSLRIDGEDIGGFKIAANTDIKAEKLVAEKFRELVYETTGVYLEITKDANGNNLIVITKVDDGNFTVTASNKKLTFAYSHENMLERCFSKFLTEKIQFARGELSFSGEIYKKDTTVIYYDDFGAVGDGKTNDFEAIYNAHEAANLGGQTVKATPGKTYYIKSTRVLGVVQTATIKTNVVWTGANFIIDDRGAQNGAIFKVSNDSDRSSLKITNKTMLDALSAQKIGPGTTKIEIPEGMYDWDGSVMLMLYNSSHSVYNRRGYGSYTGDTQKELIIVDKDGNISPETPIMFDYFKVSQVTVYRLDESRAITIDGGKFTTIAAQTYTGYLSRNLAVYRSFTTVKNVEHYVEGEVTLLEQASGKMGAAYSGFYTVGSCTNVTFKDCVMTGRRYYNTGTYEFSANSANKVILDGCTQSNFWVTVDENYNIRNAEKGDDGAKVSQASVRVNGKSLKITWGAGSSNWCKNLEYHNSAITRYDAHAGVYNGKIIGCDIGGIELTGWGELIIEDTNIYSYGTGSVANSLLYLRNDYGSTWNGEITLKNVNAYFTTKNNATAYLFYHSYVNWYFGYSVAFPSITIDNMKCYGIEAQDTLLPAGHQILLSNNNISSANKMHLPDSHSKSNYSIIDRDGDGFVDEPTLDLDCDGRLDEVRDLDGDGVAGNTSILYKDARAAASDVTNGTYHPTSYANLNIVKPPEFIKVLNNTGDGSFILRIKNTAGSVSDGGYYDEEDNNGGFFGDTKFYYSDTEYLLGTNHIGQTETNSFYFYN